MAADLWHVTKLAGERHDRDVVLAALVRLAAERPFFLSGRYDGDRAELRYWEEASDCSDACALALRLWFEHLESAGLPPWKVAGLEVISREEYQRRGGNALAPAGGWTLFPA